MKPTLWGGSLFNETRESTWRKALENAHGNITHAAEAIGIHRVQASRLTKQLGLAGFAKELRIDFGRGRVDKKNRP